MTQINLIMHYKNIKYHKTSKKCKKESKKCKKKVARGEDRTHDLKGFLNISILFKRHVKL